MPSETDTTRGSSSRSRAAEVPSDNLPLQLTSFVGREKEISEVEGLLSETRLLTLCGPGGCGKTRMALAVAFEVARRFGEGVWWVELASLSDPDIVPQTVASVLGVRETPGRSATEALMEYLASRRTLLILDNCEHLVDACAVLAESLLHSCPNLCILTTSREVLNIAGEVSWPVPPLSLPDPRRLPAIESLTGYESARLFVERARAVRPDFALDERNASAVARICYRLDGMPLAIELAAARVKVLSAEQISERLENSLGLLTFGSRTATPRQRTLRATLEWSHDLLEEPERKLLGRLSVFAGGWTLEAAEAVGVGSGIAEYEVLELLSHLVDKSLVMVAETSGEDGVSSRYRMLEPVRQYSLERLEESGEADAARSRHAAFFLALAEEAEPELRGPDQLAWLERLEREHDNFRAALSWTLDRDAQFVEGAGLRLAAALWKFWNSRSHLSEGRGWLERGLSAGGTGAAVRAKALVGLGRMAILQGDGRATATLEESLSLFREIGDRAGVATALGNLGRAVVFLQIEKWRLPELREEAEALRRETFEGQATNHLLFFLTLAAMDERDYERAEALAEEKLVFSRNLGNVHDTTIALAVSGMIALKQGDHERAVGHFEENLRLLRKLGDAETIVHCLLGLAMVAVLREEPVRTARLWGAAEALRDAIGSSGTDSPFARAHFDYENLLADARSRLDDDAAWEAAWSKGRAMTPEEATDYALSREEEKTTAPEEPSLPAGLSAREAEVLGLVAKGLTNARVAKELFISPRTVNRHLNSVYQKIGVSSRAAATRFAVKHGLV